MFLSLLYVELLLSLHCSSHLLPCNNSISYRAFNHIHNCSFFSLRRINSYLCDYHYLYKNIPFKAVVLWINKSGCKKAAASALTLKQSLLENTEDMFLIDQRYTTEDNRLSDRFRPLSSPCVLLVSVQFAYHL